MRLDVLTDEGLKTILSELKRRFEELYGNRLVKMILYGSQARGDMGRWSDIDVLVILQAPVRPSLEIRRTGGIVSSLSLQFDTVIQCLFMDEDGFQRHEEPLLDNVRKEGIEV